MEECGAIIDHFVVETDQPPIRRHLEGVKNVP